MIYHGSALGAEQPLSVEREGLRIGARFVDYADFAAITPMNHRVLLDTLAGERSEISMLGFSYDGFWEELLGCFAARSLAALFAEGEPIMRVEGEYRSERGQGRAWILLYPDAVCILPPDCGATRIPLCFTEELRKEGYLLHLATRSGTRCTIGRMGYDTQPFFERADQAAKKTKQAREERLHGLTIQAPYTQKGLFRTTQQTLSWRAAYGNGVCAVELETNDDAATYLYRFAEPAAQFAVRLEEAMEAMGPHREILYISEQQLNEKPLYRMAVVRCPAVRQLRSLLAGRLIHTANHAERLDAFLRGAGCQ